MRVIALIGWALLIGLVLLWEGLGLAREGDAWPTLSDMMKTVTRPLLGRAIVFAIWLWLGWQLFVRGWRLSLPG